MNTEALEKDEFEEIKVEPVRKDDNEEMENIESDELFLDQTMNYASNLLSSGD